MNVANIGFLAVDGFIVATVLPVIAALVQIVCLDRTLLVGDY